MRDIEIRSARTREIRVEAAGAGRPARLVGIAAVYDSASAPLLDDKGEPYLEIVEPGAFAAAISGGDVFAFDNHCEDKVLGRTGAGTLKLWDTPEGLGFDCELPDTGYARDLAVSVGRGDRDSCSFGFTVDPGGDQVEPGEGMPLRRLLAVNLVEISLGVVYPAYRKTSVAVRSIGRRIAEAAIPAATAPTPTPPEVPAARRRLAAARRWIQILD